MSRYLLHQTRDGMPVGVFSETDHYYLPAESAREKYGIAVVKSRGSDTSWEDFMEQQASKSPSPTAMWDVYEADGSLELNEVLAEARENTTYGD